MNNLIPFQFESNQIRVIDRDGAPWFVAADVCGALGIKNPSDAISKLDDDERGLALIETPGGAQRVAIINESGLYTLILRCRDAVIPGTVSHRFRKWVTAEVLPSIRKTGRYESPAFTTPQSFSEALRLAADLHDRLEESERQRVIAEKTKAEIGSRREATAMNTASQAVKRVNQLEIQLDRSQAYCTIKRAEMLFHGQKFNWRLLKSASNDLGIPPIDVFDSNYGTVKAYHVDAWFEAYAIYMDLGFGRDC